MKDFCRQVLRFFPTSRTPRYERIHPVEFCSYNSAKCERSRCAASISIRSSGSRSVAFIALSEFLALIGICAGGSKKLRGRPCFVVRCRKGVFPVQQTAGFLHAHGPPIRGE